LLSRRETVIEEMGADSPTVWTELPPVVDSEEAAAEEYAMPSREANVTVVTAADSATKKAPRTLVRDILATPVDLVLAMLSREESATVVTSANFPTETVAAVDLAVDAVVVPVTPSREANVIVDLPADSVTMRPVVTALPALRASVMLSREASAIVAISADLPMNLEMFLRVLVLLVLVVCAMPSREASAIVEMDADFPMRLLPLMEDTLGIRLS